MAVNSQQGANPAEFVFPRSYNFPPFFSPQPNALTLQAQLKKWSLFLQRYCKHHHIFKLTIIEALDTPLFHNSTLKKRLSLKDAKAVIDYMASKEGDERAEWLGSEKSEAWIWWRKPEEWATLIATWVEDTGQKGTVLTLYELVEGEATEKQEFHGLDMDVLRKSLNTLVKKGKAQVFGTGDQQGVKFF
ncbi:WNK lysine deficient protein kinase [Exophiala viscosa]|uniref:Vacuolar protein-sorting-associated protein 25 n=1 Tax=Exophiala viscosa TaxID=2486360 RepID=A0AAN6E3W5_9EURO|nr:WNK lysine deficient protein kinase [Exophiala viscosa]KAI1629778.1 WNK lysine deficient protein kinase [Exophiala viscosa]